jgi:hypothetical protein
MSPPFNAQRTLAAGPRLDAIYVPTKGRVDYVCRLLDTIFGNDADVYLLPTDQCDMPSDLCFAYPRTKPLVANDTEFTSLVCNLRSQANPVFGIKPDEWDLPFKRNYALWHAAKNGFRQILLLDDDIRGLSHELLSAGADALSTWAVTGYFIDAFPDTSVVGHVERALGLPVKPFLSGSCLFLRANEPIGFFPPIYNEDWIFMAPAIQRRRVYSLGVIGQEPYDPFVSPVLASFQEPGEIIADGLFALLSAGRYHEKKRTSIWRSLLQSRRAWLKDLALRVQNRQHRDLVTIALERCHDITEQDCARFISDIDADRDKWLCALAELRL